MHKDYPHLSYVPSKGINWTDEKRATAVKLYQEYGIAYRELDTIATQMHDKVNEAIIRIYKSPFNWNKTFLGHSGGKDSVLVRWLADLAGGDSLPTVHTPKPEGIRNAVHPLTKEFLYARDRIITYIPESKVQGLFGPGTQYETQIDGTRRSEADRRDGRDVGLIVNGEERSRSEVSLYMSNGLFGLNFIYPIFDWADKEVWATIFAYDIPFSPEYHHD